MSETKVRKIDNHSLARNHPEIWKFIKFVLVSILGAGPQTAAQLGFSYLFKALGTDTLPNFFLFNLMAKTTSEDPKFLIAHVVYASICAVFIGQIISFVLNRTISFNANSNIAVSGFYNILLALLTIILSGAFVTPFVMSIGSTVNQRYLNGFLSEDLLIIILNQLAMAVPTLWIYPANRFIIHRVKKQEPEEAPAEQEAATV